MMSVSPPGHERKVRELNPPLHRENRLSRAARPTDIRLPPVSVDPPGVEPGSPACHTGVFPLDRGPVSQWTAGDSNPEYRRAKPVSSRLDEQPILPVIPHGLEPWFPACDAGVV